MSGRGGAGVLALVFILLLGACSAAPEWADPTGWFEETTKTPENERVQVPEGGGTRFPNLASVPDEPPPAMSKEERERLAEELRSDRASANYSTEPLRSSVRRTAADGKTLPPDQAQGDQAQGDQAQGDQLSSEMIAVIYFDFASAGLDTQDLEILQQVAAIQRAEGGSLRVVGHASLRPEIAGEASSGGSNLRVSADRAKAVAAALQSLVAPEPSIAVEARSSNQPVYEESQPNGEAGNRRVEIFLEFQSGKR